MSETTPPLPAWVKKRDGRVVPFDPDVIGQDLFAAAESVGHADPFLTRELTDGVLHFLALDCPEPIPTTAWIADLVVKIVRELRQPSLALAFSQRALPAPIVGKALASSPAAKLRRPHEKPSDVVRRSLEAYSLEAVFSRDLAAAHREGLLVLGSLHSPRELTAGVLTPPEPTTALPALQLLDALLEARGGVADWLALDGVEHLALESGSPPLPRLFTPILQAAGLTARLHLNAAEPPPWARRGGHGPLFADQASEAPVDPLRTMANVVQSLLHLEREHCPFAIDWHLGERDFAADVHPTRGDLLESMVRAALGEYPVTFVFDRPRRLVSLGPGLDRLHTCLLMTVGLDLPRLLEHTGSGDDVELFLRKLASLARLAVSAGVQKRHYLRETLHERGFDRSFLQRGFLLDRARVLVTPLGMERAIQTLIGIGIGRTETAGDHKNGVELARRIVKCLDEVLVDESKRRLVDCVVETTLEPPEIGGYPTALQQLSVASRIHAVTGTGVATIALVPEERLTVDHVMRLLEFTWRQTDVARLRLQAVVPGEEQMTLLQEQT